jgi:hypothetical protein
MSRRVRFTPGSGHLGKLRKHQLWARAGCAPLYGDPDVIEVARALMQEAAAVARAAGCRMEIAIVGHKHFSRSANTAP